MFFLLVLVGFCAAVAALLPPRPPCSRSASDLFALPSDSWWIPEACGTLESKLRSIFTSRDVGGLWEAREPLALWPVFPRSFWGLLWGLFESLGQTVSDFGLLQLILTGEERGSWSGWAGLWVGQGQGFGYCTLHDGQWPYGADTTSVCAPALCFCDLCLEDLSLSLLVSLLSLLFLQWPVFVLTLGLSRKFGSFFSVATTSLCFTLRAASVRSTLAGFEETVVHEGFLLQLFRSPEGGVWLLCCL